jgi:hypothetical protein
VLIRIGRYRLSWLKALNALNEVVDGRERSRSQVVIGG